MEDRQVGVLIDQASTQRRLGNYRGSIELLQRALSLDPDNARAHAHLALSLCGVKRLPGAEIEAKMALHLDGNDSWSHYVAAFVYRAQRRLDDAWNHCLVAVSADNNDIDSRVLGANIRAMRGERTEARELINEALEIDPNHVHALTELARIEFRSRDYDAARRAIMSALKIDAADLDAHVMAGQIDLAMGDEASAESHARFVLNQSATDHDGLLLWTAIKARRSKVLGLWWRFSMLVSNRSESGQIGIVIGSFVLVRVLVILAQHYKLETLAFVIQWGWFGFCAYTWYAPTLFRKMLQRDLGTVTLDPDY
ncbi:MAG TPA: tetratricopeptide repeat protein [Kofleriaceae bacterium]|jgi:tetratricopeptide (TPR) repeat protein